MSREYFDKSLQILLILRQIENELMYRFETQYGKKALEELEEDLKNNDEEITINDLEDIYSKLEEAEDILISMAKDSAISACNDIIKYKGLL